MKTIKELKKMRISNIIIILYYFGMISIKDAKTRRLRIAHPFGFILFVLGIFILGPIYAMFSKESYQDIFVGILHVCCLI